MCRILSTFFETRCSLTTLDTCDAFRYLESVNGDVILYNKRVINMDERSGVRF
jgi:hypothetical protein